jgi:hypothetical protein
LVHMTPLNKAYDRYIELVWLVVEPTPLKNISQLG